MANFLFVAVVLTLVILVWRLPEIYRTRRLKTLMPESLVLSSAKIPSLEKALRVLAPEIDRLERPIPWGISLVLDADQLSLWRGLGREFVRLPWAAISRTYVGEAAEVTRTSPAICFDVQTTSGPVLLEMVIFGRGPFQAIPFHSTQLLPLVETIERFRDAAAGANPPA